MSFLSEVIIKISSEGGKFKGHIFGNGEHIVTSKSKTRESAITKAVSEAKDVLEVDNILKTVEVDAKPANPEKHPSHRDAGSSSTKDSRSKSG